MFIASYFSWVYYACLLPALIALYAISPKKLRPYTMLTGCVAFYALSGNMLPVIAAQTLFVYLLGRLLGALCDREKSASEGLSGKEKKAVAARFLRLRRLCLAFGVTAAVTALALQKYLAFAAGGVNFIASLFGLETGLKAENLPAALGVSYYTLSMISYLADVYSKKLPAERSVVRLALFTMNFATVMEGPICRYGSECVPYVCEPIEFKNLRSGIERILLGFFKKIVIADRLNYIVGAVFDSYGDYSGAVVALAGICYTLQLYADFSGAMDVVLGSMEIFAVKLPENFSQPFFSKSISEFWQRWHITLGAWLKDYVYYPLSMSKRSKKLTRALRKRLGAHYGPLIVSTGALLCVWLLNGLWHGAGGQYILFGMYHFVLITLGNIVRLPSDKLLERLKIKQSSVPLTVFRVLRTCLLVCVGELFFRARSAGEAFLMLGRIFSSFASFTAADGKLFTTVFDVKECVIAVFALALLLALSILRERGVDVRQRLAQLPTPIRWSLLLAFIMIIVIFGAYGEGYKPVDPIYADF